MTSTPPNPTTSGPPCVKRQHMEAKRKRVSIVPLDRMDDEPAKYSADSITPTPEWLRWWRAQQAWEPPTTFGGEALPSFKELVTTPDTETGISVLQAVTGNVRGLSKLEELRTKMVRSGLLMTEVRRELPDVLAAMRLAGNPIPLGGGKPSLASAKMLLHSLAKPLEAPDFPTPGMITIEKMFVTHTAHNGTTFILAQWVGHALRLAACHKPGGADCWASVKLNPQLQDAIKYLPTVDEAAIILRIEPVHFRDMLCIDNLENREMMADRRRVRGPAREN